MGFQKKPFDEFRIQQKEPPVRVREQLFSRFGVLLQQKGDVEKSFERKMEGSDFFNGLAFEQAEIPQGGHDAAAEAAFQVIRPNGAQVLAWKAGDEMVYIRSLDLSIAGEEFIEKNRGAKVIYQFVGEESVIAKSGAPRLLVPVCLLHPAEMLPGIGVEAVNQSRVKSTGNDLFGPVA